MAATIDEKLSLPESDLMGGQDGELREYQSEIARRLLRWKAGEVVGPYRIEYYPTNRCNLQCKHCWQRTDDYDKTYASELEDERILRLADEAAALGVRHWTIKGGGEPMARGKVIMRLAERITELGMQGSLHTNGSLFKPAQLERLVDIGWGHIVVSLDGPDAEINDYLRTGGFEKARENLLRIKAYKEKTGRKSPVVHLNMVVTRTNVAHLDRMIEFAHETGCSRVFASGLISFSAMCDEFMLGDEERDMLPVHVERALVRARELGILTALESFLDEGLATDPNAMEFGTEFTERRGLMDTMCYKPYFEMTIHPDGKVGPCCMSYDERSNNVETATLEEVWTGKYLKNVREHFEHNRPMSYCHQCPTPMYREIGDLRSKLRTLSKVDDLTPFGRAVALSQRAASSLREQGMSRTLQRTREWLQVHRG